MVSLGPKQLLDLVNSSSLGKVLHERTLRRHRQEYDLGDLIDVLEYTRCLISKRQTQLLDQTGGSYEDKKEQARVRSAEVSKSGRDIGEIPEVADPQQREACRHNLQLYLETYHAETFCVAWSPDHILVIEQMQVAILKGGQFALAMPRGSGKTSITEAAALWAILYGHRKFVALIGNTKDDGLQMLESIKTHLETSQELLADFPEVCYPIELLEGIASRCRGQLFKGKRTRIAWQANTLILPSIPGSVASGAIIKVRGITGAIRGMKFKRDDGTIERPDIAILDDPQDDESAASLVQTEKRIRTVNGAIRGLAGPGKKMTIVIPCTVIAKDDLADYFLDIEKNPTWQSIRIKMLKAFPKDLQLWEEYFEIRDDDLRARRGVARANKFYKKHRKKLDAGANVYWKERFEEDEISAIQHAMHKWHDDPLSFAAEFQNEPLEDGDDDSDLLTADEIMLKVNGYKQAEIPQDATTLVSFTDVQKYCLYTVVLAVAEDMTAWIVDYETFPKQPTHYFQYKSIQKKFGDLKRDGKSLKRLSPEGQIRAALEMHVNEDLMLREYLRDDGLRMPLDRSGIDIGYQSHVIARFVRESSHKARLTPAKGKGYGKNEKSIAEIKKKPGERKGLEWFMPRTTMARGVRHIFVHTKFWKTYFQARLSTPKNEVGSLSLYMAKPHRHRMLAEHLTAEKRRMEPDEGGNPVAFYDLLIGRDNHYLDGAVGCFVMASMEGCELAEQGTTKKVKQVAAKKSWSEMQRSKKAR
ncbi:MAG: hypothetical protein COA78_24800 [Blastopirellula sp.]|nr:MAG: hypothetical protein COA78_24800 [Blastopirellula sp.]